MPIIKQYNFKPTDSLFKIRYQNFIVGSASSVDNHVIDLEFFNENLAPKIGEFSGLISKSLFNDIPTVLEIYLHGYGGEYRLVSYLDTPFEKMRSHKISNRIRAYGDSWWKLKDEARGLFKAHWLTKSSVIERPTKPMFET